MFLQLGPITLLEEECGALGVGVYRGQAIDGTLLRVYVFNTDLINETRVMKWICKYKNIEDFCSSLPR